MLHLGVMSRAGRERKCLYSCPRGLYSACPHAPMCQLSPPPVRPTGFPARYMTMQNRGHRPRHWPMGKRRRHQCATKRAPQSGSNASSTRTASQLAARSTSFNCWPSAIELAIEVREAPSPGRNPRIRPQPPCSSARTLKISPIRKSPRSLLCTYKHSAAAQLSLLLSHAAEWTALPT